MIEIGCLLILVLLLAPRLSLFVIWLATDWLGKAYETSFWPFIGFLFMPYTTIAYMVAMLNNDHQISGVYLPVLILAIIFDLSVSSSANNQ